MSGKKNFLNLTDKREEYILLKNVNFLNKFNNMFIFWLFYLII